MPLLNRSHSHTIPYCDIRLDDNVVVLRGTPEESAGALLKGTLAFCITESVPVRSITLSLVGVRRLHWQEKTSTVTTGVSVKSESVVFSKKWEFLEFSHKHPVTLRPDNYEYDFDAVLPGDLPESIEGLESAQIFYRLKAVIERPRFAQNITAKKHLRIVRTLSPGALELSQTMSVENFWPDKVEYSISIPTKAIVFGSSIPIDIILVPLLKGLTVGKVICVFKELHSFSNPEKGTTRNDMRTVLEQTFENGEIETEEGEDFGRWKLQDRVELPKSLIRCVQDCEVECVKVRHKLKFTIQLHNPDGHTSELRASLPVQLFISPNLMMGEDNIIHGASSSEDLTLHQVQAPPRYDDHYLDRLYQGLPQDHYETPMHTPLPSRPNSPNLSRQNSSENLAAYPGSDSGRSGSSTPLRIPGHRSAGSSSAPLVSPPSPSRAMAEEVAARLSQRDSEDYFSRRAESSGHTPHHSGPSTRAHSPDELHEDELDLGVLSKVPSYSTAVRSGTRNLSSASNLPTYEDGFRSASASLANSPRNSPPSSSMIPAMQSGRDGSDRQRSRGVLGRHHTGGATDSSSGGHSLISEAERRLRGFQLRGR
ncbi:hypothetical protein L873DRAFT_1693575 [Choiromyces venosus 120613-1]|uniref:Arrestin C-terminal-like domain-containing protein n=1 Tax=Choiromyces venosus 120613-1 TaxID=1336337 RepID=A0A3N4JHE0_9PEZI|nr:hypothetical protein L873DRAFT_1693575 [Choiromyces venosus 120613-1]